MNVKQPAFVWSCLGLLLLVSFSEGCRGKAPNADSFKKAAEKGANAVDGLKALGAKIEIKRYPAGTAQAIDLSGAMFTDDTVTNLKILANERISELRLARSTITDAQLGDLANSNVGSFLNFVDLSNTAVTSAGLMALVPCKFIAKVEMKGTKITDAEVDAFKKAHAASEGVYFPRAEVVIK